MVGAGIGGLATALDLACAGVAVTVVEAAETPGGKVRQLPVGGTLIDAGPTVLTMRWVFEALLEAAGTSVAAELSVRPLDVLARHAWSAHERLDLHADVARSAEAIGDFAGAAEARGFLDFCSRAARVYKTLEGPFLRGTRLSSPLELTRRVGLRKIPDLIAISPFLSLWDALAQHFRDPRLQQLFGRFSTYVGSSPFRAPATLMLIAHVEQSGVWIVDGGMHALALALARVAARQGVTFRYGTPVAEVVVEGGRAAGVTLATGERISAGAVVLNTDVGALAAGLLGRDTMAAARPVAPSARSLSALTWTIAAETDGFPLHHHTVFFSRDYRAEFARLFGERRLPAEPTVYVCAQDRGDAGDRVPQGPERLLCLVNAPATGDEPADDDAIAACARAAVERLDACGLRLRHRPEASRLTTPNDFNMLFPGTGGALYGRASHGWMASFRRPGSRTRVPGLYLAGGSTHPGPGLPMAALSGRLAAAALIEDLASTSPSSRVAISGGTSTP